MNLMLKISAFEMGIYIKTRGKPFENKNRI